MGEVSFRNGHLLFCIPLWFDSDVVDRCRRTFPDLDVTVLTDKDPPPSKALMRTVDYYCGTFMLPGIEDLPKLKFVQLLSAGFDRWVNHPLITDSDVPFASVSGIHGPPIAEWVVLNWLVASRKYNTTYEMQKQHEWDSSRKLEFHRCYDHVRRRVGILGYGSIGRQVARVASALGMDVVAHTFNPRRTPESKRDTGYIVPRTGDPDGSIPIAWFSGGDKASLHRFLVQDLDYLVISVPLTPDTRHFLGTDEFAVLSQHGRRAPFVSNISRGAVLDQDALVASLRSGELGGAALDVTDPEPLPPDSPLWDAPNVQISPHVSATGVEYLSRGLDILKINLTRLARGDKLLNEYRRGKGY